MNLDLFLSSRMVSPTDSRKFSFILSNMISRAIFQTRATNENTKDIEAIFSDISIVQLSQLYQFQFLLSCPAFDFCFALKCRASVRLFFCIEDFFCPLCPCVIAAQAVLVSIKSLFQVISNAGVNRPIFAFQEIYKIHMCPSKLGFSGSAKI